VLALRAVDELVALVGLLRQVAAQLLHVLQEFREVVLREVDP